LRARTPDINRIGSLKEVAMKATAIFPKCRPAHDGADTAAAHRHAPIHMPPRRPARSTSMRAARAAPGVQSTVAAPDRAQADAGQSPWLPATVPHVLHIDNDLASAQALAALLTPEARVTHVQTLADARACLQKYMFAAVVIDPDLPDGDATELLPALTAIPLLAYSASQPHWRQRSGVYLPKPWTSPRQLWTTISKLLGIDAPACAGD
jgi:two-component system phosphate regulon response regulator OmpR